MRVLLLLRGSPGCGKSTWIEQHGLKNYTLCADDIRMLCSSPCMTVTGGNAINQLNDHIVWSTLFKLLELRMQNGEFTVIDATNSKTSEMNRYKELCDSYRYRIYCVDFTGVPIEVVKERNRMRPEVKRVPDEAIDKMYARFQTQKIPSGITVIKPNELDSIWMKKIDVSSYKKVHHIGDIHGCYTALKEYFDRNGGFKNDELYIFCGDFIDRGVENAEVLRFLLGIYKEPNVWLLEGNHERWLWIWANDGVCQSKEFELVTKLELEREKINKKLIRQFYRKIGQCAYYEYCGSTYLVTHGGLSNIPQQITTVATSQMIKGVGTYDEVEIMAEAFVANTPTNCYQIHGHRNTKNLPTQTNERVFNLEGHVERGGCLRCVQLNQDGTRTVVEIQNYVFKTPEEIAEATPRGEQTVGDMIIALRQNQYVQEKRYGNISSFNFTKAAFYDKIWDEQTTRARGLYIDIARQKIAARAYDKFFNINERPETKLDMLQYRMQFPAVAYVKENGFLGIVSYDADNDSLFITTKSAPDGEFATWLREMFARKYDADTLERIKEHCKEHDVSFVFECVDMTNDPHIIEYEEDRLFLLDIVYNDMKYQKYGYEEMCAVAQSLGLQHKEKAFVLESWQDFFDWYYNVTNEDYQYNGRHVEGFVVEDANGFMVKIKLHYYNFWKFMRSIAHEAIRKGYVDPKRTSALTSALANQFYGWVKTLHGEENVDLIPRDICSLRRMFYASEAGKLSNE